MEVIIQNNKIHSIIKLNKLNNDLYEVKEDIIYNVFGGQLIVPKGFKTDLASIPKFINCIIPKRGLYDAGAILHDFLYSEYSIYDINREDSDKIFEYIIHLCGVPKDLSLKMYYSVRAFGESHFSYIKLNGNKPLERVAFIDKRECYLSYKQNLKKIMPNFT